MDGVDRHCHCHCCASRSDHCSLKGTIHHESFGSALVFCELRGLLENAVEVHFEIRWRRLVTVNKERHWKKTDPANLKVRISIIYGHSGYHLVKANNLR